MSSTSCPSGSPASGSSRRSGPRGSADASGQQLDAVAALVRGVLGKDAVGAYLYGSALRGGLRPRSDLDVLVVAGRTTTAAEKSQLAGELLGVSGRPRPVEVTVVAEPELTPWRYPPRFDFQFGEWHRSELERGRAHLGPTTSPDVALLLTMARQASRPLFGPPAAELLEDVPANDVTRALLHAAEEVRPGLVDDTRNSVLTLARIWLTLETGEIAPKDVAAAWALERLPAEHRAVPARARAIYLGNEEERWDDLRLRVLPYADHVAGEIRRRGARGAS